MPATCLPAPSTAGKSRYFWVVASALYGAVQCGTRTKHGQRPRTQLAEKRPRPGPMKVPRATGGTAQHGTIFLRSASRSGPCSMAGSPGRAGQAPPLGVASACHRSELARSGHRPESGEALPSGLRPRETRRPTGPSTPSAHGSTRGLVLGTSRWAWTVRATTCNWLSTMTEAGGPRSTRPAWSIPQRVRPAPGGSARRGTRRSARRGLP